MSLVATEPQPSLAWQFENSVVDSMAGVTMTINGTGVGYGAGKYGQAISIQTNGTTVPGANYMSFTSSTTFSSTVSVCCWVNFKNILTNNYIFHARLGGSSGNFNIWTRVSGVVVFDNGTNQSQTASGLSSGVWYHLVGVVNGSTVTLYVNGVAQTPAATSVTTSFNGGNIGFQYFGTSPGFAPFTGLIDDFRIYNTALSAAQVQTIYQAQGMPSRVVQINQPIQPGYIYELNINNTNVGTPSVAIINASNSDPRTYMGGDTARIDQWNTVPNLLTLWDTTPFKYYMIFLSGGYTYQVNIPTAGTYNIDLLFVGPGGGVDSFFIHMDSDADTIATSYPSYPTSFTWLTALTKTLTAGAHTVQITAREPSGLAAIRVVPSGGSAPTLPVFRMNMSGAPLFNQLSPSAAASAVGAFSLRAVNGVTAKAMQVTQYTLLEVPPVALTQNTFTATGTFNGVTNGQYVALCSSYSSTSDAWRVFDKNIGTRGATGGTEYTVGTGAYIGSASTVDSTSTTYNGGWFQIRIPSAVNAVSYSVSVHSSYTLTAPYTWKLFGSTTGSSGSWVVLDTKTSYVFGAGTVNFPLSQLSAGYTYFRLAANRISPSSTAGDLGPAELIIYGYSSLVSSTQDFYADERGNLWTVPIVGQTLANWLGGATGYVTKWYDQSGRGNHMSCSSIGIQPKIDLTNAWIDFKTSAYFDTSANPASGPVPYSNTMNYTIICRHNTIGNNNGGICGSRQSNNPNLTNNFRRITGNYVNYWYANDQVGGTYATGNKVTFKWDGTNRYIYGNGTLQTTTASSNWWQISSSEQLIGKTTADVTMNGEMYSIFMFTTALSDSDRVLVENFS